MMMIMMMMLMMTISVVVFNIEASCRFIRLGAAMTASY